MSTHRPLLLLLGVAALVPAACDGAGTGDDGAEPASGLVLATAPLGDCEWHNGDNRFPADANKLVLRLTGGNIPGDEPVVKAVSRLAAGGVVQLDEIEPGAGVTLDVVACDGTDPVWSGLTRGIEIPEPGESVEADVYLTRLDSVTRVGRCPSGTELDTGHAFASTLRADEETAWVFGGFDSSSGTSFSATDAVESYDRVSSEFSSAGALAEVRGLALAQGMTDGRVRVIGGATGLTLAISGPLVYPTGAPANGVEFYDPASRSSAGGVALTLPAMPAVVGFADGTALAVGGADGASGGTAAAWVLPADMDEASDATEIALDEPLFGATVVPVDAVSGALVFGGRTGSVDGDIALWIDIGDGTTTQLTGDSQQGWPTYASGGYLGESGGQHHFLVLGGTDVNAGGTLSFTNRTVTPRMERVSVDLGAGTMTSTQVSLGTDGPVIQRAMGSLVEVGDGTWWLVGGFASFGKNEDVCGADVDVCIPSSLPRFAVGLQGAPVLALVAPEVGLDSADLGGDLGAFGAGALALGDGSWLVLSGFDRTGVSADTDAGMARFEVDAAELCDAVVSDDEE